MHTLELILPDGLSRIQHHLYLKVVSYCNQVLTIGRDLKRILDGWNLPLPENYGSYDDLASAFSRNYDQVHFMTPSDDYWFVVKEGRTLVDSIIPISINQAFRVFLQSRWMMDFDLEDFDKSTISEFTDSTLSVIASADQISRFLEGVTSKYEQVDAVFKEQLQISQPIKDNFTYMMAPIAKLYGSQESRSLPYSAECVRPQLMNIRAHIYKMIFICLLYDYATVINNMTTGMQNFLGALINILNKCLSASALHRIVFSKSSVKNEESPETRGEDDNTSRLKMYFEHPLSPDDGQIFVRTKIVVLRIDLPHKDKLSVHLNICGEGCAVETCMNHKEIDISEKDTLLLIDGLFEYILANVPEMVTVSNDKRQDQKQLIERMNPYVYSRYYFATHRIDQIDNDTELEDEFCVNIGLPLHSKLKQLTDLINRDFKPDVWLR